MANETILVTGSTGQVGRRLVPRLLSWREPGDAVRVLVRAREAAERFEALGEEIAAPERRSPEYFAQFVAKKIERWSAPIKASGASVD